MHEKNCLADILSVKHLFCSGKSKVCWSNKSQIKVCVCVCVTSGRSAPICTYFLISSVAEAAAHFQFDQTGLFSSALRQWSCTKATRLFIPKYGEIKFTLDSMRGEKKAGNTCLLISNLAVIPPPPPFSLSERTVPQSLSSNCRTVLCGNCWAK